MTGCDREIGAQFHNAVHLATATIGANLYLMERLKSTGSESIPKPVEVILNNRARLAEKIGREVHHTPPSMDHYPHLYPWDSAAAIEILSHFGYLREAQTEVFALFDRQGPDGKVRNQQRVRGMRSKDPELKTFTEPDQGADYSQPPTWGRAIASLYYAMKEKDPDQALLLLDEILPKNIKSFRYFADNRRIAPGNPLIFNVKGEETGRDHDEALNGYAPKLPSKGPATPYIIELLNTGSHNIGRLALGGLNRINGWDPSKIKRYHPLIDPMFNSIYAEGLRITAVLSEELGERNLAQSFYDEASSVEERIIKDLYEPSANEGKGAFLVNNKGPVDEISISGTGPLALENLPPHMISSILDMMDDHLDAPFPVSTLSTKSRHYDPEGRRLHSVWNGDVMMIGNWFEVVHLRKQADRLAAMFNRPDLVARCLEWSEGKIIPRSKQLLKQGYYESFSSQTGRPRRSKIIPGNFVWNGLIETL